MKAHALRQVSVNGVQLVLNQLFGVAIFYLLSVRLSKPDFGRVNLSLAILLALFSVLSLGMDSLAVKKTAAGGDNKLLLPAYRLHVLLSGMAGYAVLCILSPWLPQQLFPLLPLLGLGKLFLFLSTPFKQVATGREQFALLAKMSLVSNAIRCAGLVSLILLNLFTLRIAVFLFVGGDLTELVVSRWLFRSPDAAVSASVGPGVSVAVSETVHTSVSTTVSATVKTGSAGVVYAWTSLLREAAPQAGVVMITSLLARFDWICIGFLSTAGRLAEYSFAYKAFEMAQLPLLMIAPLLLPRFTRLFQTREKNAGNLVQLLHLEMIVAAGSALLIQALWSPLIDLVTTGRYGTSNQPVVTLLCCCLPLIYVNNFLWTAWFAEGRLKSILISFLLAAAVNIAGCLIFIPIAGNKGAALAFLLSSLVQTGWYLFRYRDGAFANAWKPLCLYGACALIAGGTAHLFPGAVPGVLASAFVFFTLTVLVSPLTAPASKMLREAFLRNATRQPANP